MQPVMQQPADRGGPQRRMAGAAGAVAPGGGNVRGRAGTATSRRPRKEAGIVLNVSTGNARAWRTPSNMAGRAESPTRPYSSVGLQEKEQDQESTSSAEFVEARVPPILTLPPEALAHVFGMLEPVDVVTASGANPDWLEVANELVLAPRGHLAVRLSDSPEVPVETIPPLPPERRPLSAHTLHIVDHGLLDGGPGGGLRAEPVRKALESVGRKIPLEEVNSVWLHQQRAVHSLVTADEQRATLDAILGTCAHLASLNFVNVSQNAGYVRQLVEAGQARPHFRSHFVFTERGHDATGVLVALDELGAFFEESVVVVWRPQLSVTAFYPHYWEPSCSLAVPYPADVRQLCIYGSGLHVDAYSALADMPALRELQLYDADGLCDDALVAVATRALDLSRLVVHDAPGVSSAGWASALCGPGLRAVRSLELAGCLQLDDDALSGLSATQPLGALTSVALDLEGSAKAGAVAVDAVLAACPNAETLTLVVTFSPDIADALGRVPERLARLRRLTVRVQGAGWPGDPRDAITGVDRLKRRLRAACPASVQMDVNLTFVKLGMAVSSPPEDRQSD